MVAERDAFIQTAIRVLERILVCVRHMEGGNDVFIQIVQRGQIGGPIYAWNMVEAHDALIVSHGLTHDQVIKDMMATARPVSNISFQRIHEVKSFMPIRKRSVFVTRSMNSLKGLSTTSPSTQVIVTAP
jgi:hypothetical protein